jgi:hypothetical protein
MEKLVVPRRSVFAAILLKAMEQPPPNHPEDWPTVVHLSKEIVELKKNFRLDTSHISMRADRGGWISDDLSTFVNRFVLFGLATRNPVELSERALDLCRQALREDHQAHPKEVDRLIQAVGLRNPPLEQVALRA